jgi:actin cytoskeleton-regulatory complex protein PAN1
MQTGFPAQQSMPQFQQQQFQPQPTQLQSSAQLMPAQTGFPGQPNGYLNTQPTGFVGTPASGFGLGSRPAPPLPPQPSFLSQPPPIPQRTQQPLLPQQTGFPGMRSLVPQMTGYVDPRLQMLSSTFMPANTSSPYATSGAPILPSVQNVLPSGIGSLQQGIQQHNQQMYHGELIYNGLTYAKS